MKRAALGIGPVLLPVLLLLALAGCVPAEPEPTPSSTSARTSTPSPAPTATPTPTAEAIIENALEPSTWLIDGYGVGPVDAGADVTTLGPVLPGWTDQGVTECTIHRFSDGSLDLALPLGSESTIAVIIILSSESGETASTPRTAAGIGLGSSTAEVAAAYPGIAVTDDGNRVPHFVVPDGPGYVLILLGGAGGAVNSIWVTDLPSLPMDLC